MSLIGRIARTIVPPTSRYISTGVVGADIANGGHWIDHSPVATSVMATAPGTAWTWGNLMALLATAATDLWVESLVLSQPSVANAEYHIGITMETGAGALTPAQAEAVVCANMNGATEMRFVKIDPPVFIPAGARIAFAVCGDTAAKSATINCWAIHSANK